MSLRIIKPGILDTIQDEGRNGFQHLGVNPGGAMDLTAMKIANALCGNKVGEAVLEMHFPAPTLVFDEDVIIALSGADWMPCINEVPIQVNRPILVQKQSVLRFKKNVIGARCYLSIRGGFICDEWLGSKSTDLKASIGGHKGRALIRDDRLPFNVPVVLKKALSVSGRKSLPWTADAKRFYPDDKIEFIAGEAYPFLSEDNIKTLFDTSFAVLPKSDRMAYYLEQQLDATPAMEERISTGVTRGTIQLLPDGQLIILMADHQTTGGYPVVGCVITPSLVALAQMGSNEKVSFALTTIEAAEKKLMKQHNDLLQLQNACNFRLQQFLAE